MTSEIAIFAALTSLLAVCTFSFLLPKVTDHFKDMNYRLLKEAIEIRNSEGTTAGEKEQFDKIITTRRKAYLDMHERLFDEFDNNRRIDQLKKSQKTHENLAELSSRKRTDKYHFWKFYRGAAVILGFIIIVGIVIVSVAWWVAGLLT